MYCLNPVVGAASSRLHPSFVSFAIKYEPSLPENQHVPSFSTPPPTALQAAVLTFGIRL
jgi:hypothetical protein